MIDRIVLFGASGDLTSRLLMPAFAQLAAEGRLPDGLSILGSATTQWSREDFQQHIADALGEHAEDVPVPAREQLVSRLDYRAADVTDEADVAAVIGPDAGSTLVYLALPSGLLAGALTALATTRLGGGDAIAIEKPFGEDLESAKHLNEILREQLPAPTIFRIDHFLTDELVRRILAIRFLNRVFDPLLCALHVERVEISWLESLALVGRAGYYDRAGALRDMVQNHLMVALSLVVMEQPARLDAASFRGNRVEALRAVATPSGERIREGSVRARYTAGLIGSRSVPAYLDEPGVDPERSTETYASVDLEVRNTRWAGTPFTLRSGKAVPRDSAEIALHFRPTPHLYGKNLDIEQNVLRIGLMEPYVRLGTTVNGPEGAAVHQQLEMVSTEPGRSPYANLVLEMLRRNPTLFIRNDEAEESWRIIDPVLRAWAANEVAMKTYAAGGQPPKRATSQP